MSKAQRKGKIFVDYLRNGRGATAIAPYSTRARAGAPVSLPVAWEELPSLRSGQLTLRNAVERLQGLERDPWASYFQTRQAITLKALRALGLPVGK